LRGCVSYLTRISPMNSCLAINCFLSQSLIRMRTKIVALLSCVAVYLFCLDGNISASNPSSPKGVPKIRIAKSQRSFVTGAGKAFVPFGVTYYRPGTGWAPQVWKQFDPQATRQDFAVMRRQGVNCVRVFLSYGSFYSHEGVLDAEGLDKFDRFLSLAEEAGLYVQPTGPDLWEGSPTGQPVAIEDENTVRALEQFWKLFAARYRGRPVIFAYELKNEPELAWDSEILKKRWNGWLAGKYASPEALAAAWASAAPVSPANASIPSDHDALNSRQLLDYQTFREEIADEWTRRQAAAIKSSDPDALVTVGLIQWSVPALLPGAVKYYSAFRPRRQAKFLDFMEIHFYPFARGAFEYKSEEDEAMNLAYLESVVREVALADKPAVLAEFGWYGGGKPRFDGGVHPAATEEQQARYCRRVIETSAGFVCGWLNWGFYDAPEAGDCSQFTGLATATGQIKAWGTTFEELAKRFESKPPPMPKTGPRPVLDWDACLTSVQAAREFRQKYYEAFVADSLRKERQK
jgi:hypothetical protein